MSPRQFVFIMTDTQRQDMVGCYGNPDMRTPSLDRLASQGVRFDRAYTCQPVCGPARAALFTGTFPHTNGMWANSNPLGDNIKTVGQRLHDHGLHTAYIGKWHLDGGDYFGLGRCPDGWDSRVLVRHAQLPGGADAGGAAALALAGAEPRPQPDRRVHLRPPLLRPGDPLPGASPRRGLPPGRLLRRAAPPVRLPASRMPACIRDYRFPKRPNVWDTLEDKPEHHRAWAGDAVQWDRDALEITAPDFFGCNSFVDFEIGRVLDAVDRCAPDALVIYTSDHGDLMHSHCISNKGPAMYDEVTLMPFIVRWPGQAPAGVSSKALVSHIDVVPTLLDAAGLSHPQDAGGQEPGADLFVSRRRRRTTRSSWSSAATRPITTASAASSPCGPCAMIATSW